MLGNKQLFFWFVVSGIALLLVLRLRFDSPTWLTVLILCALIFAYTWAAWAQEHFQDERAADNLYYMGFIFTVCTLGVSLIRFSTEDDVLINHIVGDLGIGLSTTVLGLFLRVLCLRRESSEQIEHRVREELVDVAETTIARIRVTADIVEEGQIATRQALEGMNTSIKAATIKLVAGTDRLDERRSDVIDIPPDLISSRLSPALESASRSIATFTNQMDNIEIPDDLITSRTNQIFASLAETIGKLTDQISVDVHKHLSGVFDTDQAQNLIQQIEKSLIERFQAIEIPAELLTQRIEPALDQVNSSIRVFVNRMQNLSSSLEDTQQQLMKCNSYIATLDMDNVRSVVDALDAIDSLLKNVQETIDTQRNLSSAHNQHLSELSNRAEALSAVIENSLLGLSDLNNSLDALCQDTKEQAKPKTRWPWSR